MKSVLFVLALLSSFTTLPSANAYESHSHCAARAMCPRYCYGPYGAYQCGVYSVSCYVAADSSMGTACTFAYENGVGVECHGLNAEGMWADFVNPCQ